MGTPEVELIGSSRELAAFLCAQRHQQGWTQTEVAQACGTTQSAVSDLETGEVVTVTVDLGVRVAAALGFRLALMPFTAADHYRSEEVASVDDLA